MSKKKTVNEDLEIKGNLLTSEPLSGSVIYGDGTTAEEIKKKEEEYWSKKLNESK